MTSTEERLQRLEDQLAIYQAVCGYSYAVDGLNAEALGGLIAADGVYVVGDLARMEGREAISNIARSDGQRGLVAKGVAHVSTLPYVVIDGDRAVATCHTMLAQNGDNGFFIGRLSASRIELARQPDGSWQIAHRENWMLQGDERGPAILGRLNEGPASRAP
jgi:ketosteroid isomerase-like protein